MVIDGVRVEMGTKKSWDLLAGETAAGKIAVPITVANGSSEGPVLAVLAGCHPGELNGIVTSIRLAEEIEPKTLAGTLLIVPVQNIVGFQFKRGHISPLDGINMGRAYPTPQKGGEDGGHVSHQGKSPTYQVADQLFTQVICQSDYVVDLHGGEFHETLPPNIEILITGDREVDDRTRFLAKAFAFDLIWEVPLGSIPEMPSYPERGSGVLEANKNGIPAAICEVGGEGRIEEPLVELTYRGIVNVMTHLGMVQGEKTTVTPRILVGGHVLFAKRGGLCLTRTKAGDQVSRDQVLGHTIDLSGEVVETFTSPSDGILMNVVTLGVANPGDMRYVIGNLAD